MVWFRGEAKASRKSSCRAPEGRSSTPFTIARDIPALSMTTATITAAGRAGRIAGTAARGLQWACETIDWAEVGQIVLEGLKLLIVLTLLAGRATRRAWDALPVLSEQLGCWWAQALAPAPAVPVIQQPIAALAPITATLVAAREALERLIARLYPVVAA